jgi:hypothetical protein
LTLSTGVDWESQPPNASDLRRVLQDREPAPAPGPEDEYFAAFAERFEAVAAEISSGESMALALTQGGASGIIRLPQWGALCALTP